MIKGRDVILFEKIQTGTDAFNRPTYEEQAVTVENVLIEPASNDAIKSELDLSGKRVAYILHIPKDDNHDWENARVSFYGKEFLTFGDCLIYDPDLTPLAWGKKVKVEAYG